MHDNGNREALPTEAPRPRLLELVSAAIETRHYSRRTEETYVQWIKRFIIFSGRRHPRELGAKEVTAFLSHLAVEGRVAASTQNQALAALLFLYRAVLDEPLPWLDDVIRAKSSARKPSVLTADEAQRLLSHMRGPKLLMASLLYGAGQPCREFSNMRTSAHTAYSIEYFHPKVLDDIESWPADILADYARIAELLMEYGPNLRLPHSRAFGGGLFELRPRGRSRIGRAFYCFLVGRRVVVLHAFIKKSQQTPERELKLARKRMKEVLHG